MDHIEEILKCAIKHEKEAQRAGTALAIVNMAVDQGDAENTFHTLLHEDLNLNLKPMESSLHKKRYQDNLAQLKSTKRKFSSSWVLHL